MKILKFDMDSFIIFFPIVFLCCTLLVAVIEVFFPNVITKLSRKIDNHTK